MRRHPERQAAFSGERTGEICAKGVDKSTFFRYNKKAVQHKSADADMAQVAEHILGKDEVTSSNLVISSINPRKQCVCGDFCQVVFCICGGVNGRKRLL